MTVFWMSTVLGWFKIESFQNLVSFVAAIKYFCSNFPRFSIIRSFLLHASKWYATTV